ncbi:MAG TPA: CcmD family protein [Mucilaginibacter sp.]|jgi:CcmD family protein|nr:CcmD family protein [Mucilaginibacter sp.]
MKKLLILAVLILSYATVYAQNSAQPEMADALRGSGKIYIVVITIAIIFTGLAVYLFSIDRRLKKIEKEN